MRFVRGARVGVLLSIPLFSLGCVSLSSQKMSPVPSIARERTDVRYQTAQMAEQRGEWRKARDLYLMLHRLNPETPEYPHRIGVVCTQLGDYPTALQYFGKAKSLDPLNPVLLSDMGYCYYQQKDYRRAEQLLAEAVEMRPEDALAVNNLAMAIGFQGRYDESLEVFSKVNNEAQAMVNLAYIHIQKKDTRAAIALYQKVLAIDPTNQIASNALQQMKASRVVPSAKPASSAGEEQIAASTPKKKSSNPSVAATEQPKSKQSPVSRQTTEAVQAAAMPESDPFEEPSFASAASTPAMREIPEQAVPPAAEAPEMEVATNEEFEAPVITPFNSPSTEESVAAQNPVQVIEADPAAPGFQPPKELSTQDAVADPQNRNPVLAKSPGPKQSNDFDLDKELPKASADENEELTGLDWVKPELTEQSKASAAEKGSHLRSGDCFRGFCPVAIRDERRLRSTHDEFSFEFEGSTYHFSSADALAKFQEQPELYLPAAGGLDAVAAKQGQAVAQGTIDFAVWFHHRLHVFSSAENLAMFRSDPRQFAFNP